MHLTKISNDQNDWATKIVWLSSQKVKQNNPNLN